MIKIATSFLKGREKFCHIMTDLSRSPNSNPVVPVESVVGTNAQFLTPIPRITNGVSVEDEEEYTIKCICDFQGDDGNTIFCETCETWQHIECYYLPLQVPGDNDTHNCIGCEPRTLNTPAAIEQQKGKRIDFDSTERKVNRKPPSKSNKRKIKPFENQESPNPSGDKHDAASPRNGTGTSARDQPPTKRQKSGHKHSNSIATQSTSVKAPPQSRRSTSASHTLPSPSKSHSQTGADFIYEPYSPEFMTLYDTDTGDTSLTDNVHSGISVTSDLGAWSQDVYALAKATNGKGHTDVFMRSVQPVNEMPRPLIHKQYKEDTSKEYNGRHPRWVYLTTDSDLLEQTFVGELCGYIGHMKDYVQDDANRWEYLRHPLPFVFFHPALPIYIDTRASGTLLRYVRRSCKPNLSMKTFLENGSEYHFCFHANQDIEAGSQLTIPWTTDEHVRAFTAKFGGGIPSETAVNIDEGYVLDYFSKVFSDFGGCACDNPEQCSIENLARRLRILASDQQPTTNGKTKKARKNGINTSTNGNSRNNTSRSGSEAFRIQDDEEADDDHSTSTSSRSKPQSRDITPANQSGNEAKSSIQGLELSERDKRKIAAMEKAEQDKSQPIQKKKKRTSGNSVSVNSTLAATITAMNVQRSRHTDSIGQKQHGNISKSRYVDAGTTRRQSGSPTSQLTFPIPTTTCRPLSSSSSSKTFAKPNYVDASMQTEPDPEDRPSSTPPVSPTSRKPYMSLKKRLLTRAHQERVAMEERRKSEQSSITETREDNTLPQPDESIVKATLDDKKPDQDIVMPDADAGPASKSPETTISPTIEKPRPPDSPIEISTESMAEQPLPIQPPARLTETFTSLTAHASNGFRNTALRVTLPPDSMTNGAPPTPSALGQSPTNCTPSTTLAPAISSSLVQPSPIKKKLSLGDYISRRGSTFSKPETPTISTPGAIKEKDKEFMDTDSPTALVAVDHGSKTLPPVAEELDQSKESGDRAELTPVSLTTESETKAIPTADAMDIDQNG